VAVTDHSGHRVGHFRHQEAQAEEANEQLSESKDADFDNTPVDENHEKNSS
jgi:hypothetical protein